MRYVVGIKYCKDLLAYHRDVTGKKDKSMFDVKIIMIKKKAHLRVI